MAPELRKRKSVEAVKPNGAAPKAAPKASPKATPKSSAKAATPRPKRKATEDASPVSLKKQKPTKKTAVEKKKPAKKEAKADKVEEEVEESVLVEAEEPPKPDETPKSEKGEDAAEEDEQDDEHLQVLAVDLDPEDEEETNEESFEPGQDVGKIPKVPKEAHKAAKALTSEGSGVIYIGRIPHGFYEKEMKQYFSQFGPILRLRLSRNRKTGASKHFAFIEFAEASTAEVVAKTMDNYLLFGHILKCKTVAKDQLHDDVWKGANRRFKKVPWNKMAGKQLEKPLTESSWANKVAKERSSRNKKAAKLKEMGYEFEAPQLKDVPAPAAIENGDKEADKAPEAFEAAPEPENLEEAAAKEPEEPATAQEPEPEVKAVKTKAKAKTISAPKKSAAKVTKATAAKTTRPKRSKA